MAPQNRRADSGRGTGEMNREFWDGKKVFITGQTGFKGSWLTLWLSSLGAEVTGYSLPPPTTPSLYDLARAGENINAVTGDVRDYDSLLASVERSRPEILIHLAAQTVVRASYDDPRETYSTNVMGTVNVLESLRTLGRPCAVVIVTSDKCYRNENHPAGYREHEPMGGHDPYSNSKGCAELVVSAFRHSFFGGAQGSVSGVHVASARAGNVIGGGDWTKDQLMADMIRSFLKGEAVRIRNPRAVRPWQFVLEPLDGYLTLAERLATGQSEFQDGWNFGPRADDARPVSWVVERTAALWGSGAKWELDPGFHPHEDQMLTLDTSKARDGLGWTPKTHLDTALEWTAEWYKGLRDGRDARVLTMDQITRYNSYAPGPGRAPAESMPR